MRLHIAKTAARALLAALIGIVSLGAPPAALAQMGMMGGFGAGMGDLMEAAVSRRSMTSYCGLLDMSEAERDLALELHAGYLENFKQTTERFQRQMERLQKDFQESRDFTVFQEQMPPIMKEFVGRMKSLEEGVFTDLRTLADVQETDASWVRVERMRRREQARQSSMISGDAVDLVALVSEVTDDPPPAASEALLRYEEELDTVLHERQNLNDKAMESAFDNAFDMDRQAEMMEFWEDFMTKSQDLGRRAKAINARYAAEVQQLLAAEQQSAFAMQVKRRTWPSVYKQSYPERLLDAAEQMEDLTATQRDALVVIRREYSEQADAINGRWASLIDDREKESSGLMGSFNFGVEDETEEGKAQSQRKELDKRTQGRISEALTEAQRERLPDRFELDEDGG